MLASNGDLPHSSLGHFAGSSGGSAVAAAAYRSGEKLTDERTGEQHDYSRRSGVDGSEIIAPEGAADWVRDRDQLWNSGELSEKRKDSQVAREVRVALPRELAPEQRRELVREFAKAEFTGRGMVADVSYHDGNSGNPHAHILLTTRQLNSDGFGAKDRSLERQGAAAEMAGAMGREGEPGARSGRIAGADRPPDPGRAAPGGHRARPDQAGREAGP